MKTERYYPYEKLCLKYQLILSLQKTKKVSYIYLSFTANSALKKILKENNKAKCCLEVIKRKSILIL